MCDIIALSYFCTSPRPHLFSSFQNSWFKYPKLFNDTFLCVCNLVHFLIIIRAIFYVIPKSYSAVKINEGKLLTKPIVIYVSCVKNIFNDVEIFLFPHSLFHCSTILFYIRGKQLLRTCDLFVTEVANRGYKVDKSSTLSLLMIVIIFVLAFFLITCEENDIIFHSLIFP